MMLKLQAYQRRCCSGFAVLWMAMLVLFSADGQVPIQKRAVQRVDPFAPVVSKRARSVLTFDEAKELYQSGDYGRAIPAFFYLQAQASTPDGKALSQMYLARSLQLLKLYVPALYYYSQIFKQGMRSSAYLASVVGLLEIQESLQDPIFVPNLIRQNLNTKAFASLPRPRIAQVNYMIGELFSREGRYTDALRFLEFVPEGYPLHLKARILSGLTYARMGDSAQARQIFEAAAQYQDRKIERAEADRLRDLAWIQAARVAFGQGDYETAVDLYGRVRTHGEQWFVAIYERAWAEFQRQRYGAALGDIQSVTSPYFKKRHLPEAYVITSIAYFVHCQWDRVKRDIAAFRLQYTPMLKQLRAYLDSSKKYGQVYASVIGSNLEDYHVEFVRDVRRQKRFKDFHFLIRHIDWERGELLKDSRWTASGLSVDLNQILLQQRQTAVSAVEEWIRRQLEARYASLKNFSDQIDVVDFEVADAESRWLERGKEIERGERARVPRPSIPNDQWQHWNFKSEYWKDEIGFVQHALVSECHDSL